jgi:hypothetical protein
MPMPTGPRFLTNQLPLSVMFGNGLNNGVVPLVS